MNVLEFLASDSRIVFGYTLLECSDLDEAMRWAAMIPAAREASIEICAVVGTGRPR